MYFSKNSRYVLQKAQFLSPACLKGIEKNLSVKKPKDDTTKPPLRVNIPEELSETENYSKASHDSPNVSEPKSKSLIARSNRPSLNANFEGDLLPKSENEIQFSEFAVDDVLTKNKLDQPATNSKISKNFSLSDSQSSARVNYNLGTQNTNEEDYNEALRTNLYEEPASANLADSYSKLAAPRNQSYQKVERAEGAKKLGAPVESQVEAGVDPKTLYIIIDVPDKSEEKDAADSLKRENVSSPTYQLEVLNENNKNHQSQVALKADREKVDGGSFRKSKSLSQFQINKAKLKPNRKFEVHEIEDASTYVFHLRLNNNIRNKTSGIGCVPEKEFTTRSETMSYNDAPIRVRDASARSFTGLGKEVVTVDELPEVVKYPDSKRKLKSRKNEVLSESKENLLGVDKTGSDRSEQEMGASTKTDEDAGDQEPADLQYKYLLERVNHIREEKKTPFRFEKDDFGTIRSPNKNYPFKIPRKLDEAKQKESSSQENLSAESVPSVNEQEVYAETSANLSPAAELNEIPKVEPTATSAKRSFPLQHDAENFSDEKQQPQTDITDSQITKAESPTIDTSRKDQYVNIHEVTPAITTEKSKETYRKRDYPQHYSRHEMSPMDSTENTVETDENIDISQNYSTHEATAATPQTKPKEVNRKSDFSQYYSIHETTQATAKEKSKEINKKSEAPEYYSIHEPTPVVIKEKPKKMEEKNETSQYINIHDVLPETANNKSVETNPVSKKPSHKRTWKIPKPNKMKAQSTANSEVENLDEEVTDFKTSGSCVSIGCDKIPSCPMMFSVAFPPLLGAALNSRLRFNKELLFSEKWTKIEIGPKDLNQDSSQTYKTSRLSENSILFPATEGEAFDCDSLFKSREEVILNIIKNAEEESSAKTVSDSVATAANESSVRETSVHETSVQAKPSVDSLTVMKKVKEIITFDLDNVVKIFKDGEHEPGKDLSSVVLVKGDSWEVDTEELKRQIEMRRNEAKIANLIDPAPVWKTGFEKDVLGDKIDTHFPKYLPPKKEKSCEIKLSGDCSDSAITYDPKTGEFLINKELLANAISQKSREPYSEVRQTLDLLARNSERSLEMKSGDSILVFDEETQSWRVDFSILEKREQQLQLEKELTKRSELILETFEKLEKNQINTVPKPESKDKKIFDYEKKEWKAYSSDKKPREKSTKLKSPFREPDAEEIRKKNSDLYEDLFVAKKKKEVAMNNAGKNAPGLDSSKSRKESKSSNSLEVKADAKSGSQKGSESTPGRTEIPKPDSSKAPELEKEKPIRKEDDNFWESFLNMNILPRDIRDIPNIKQPPAPPPPPSAPPTEIPSVKTPKIEDPVSKTPPKKIEEPRFKIHLPFIGDKKNEKEKPKKPQISKGETTTKNPEKKPPSQPPNAGLKKKEEPETKAPPPPPPPPPASNPKRDSKTSKPPPTIGSPKGGATTKLDTSKIKAPSQSTTKIQDPEPSTKGDKTASASEHYVSDKIVEISRNKVKDNQSKVKTNKVETVKLNIVVDKRLPSKVTEINLNKKCEEKVKEPTEIQQNQIDARKPSESALKKKEKPPGEKKSLYKNFDKYKTPYSDPEYEEKSMKIKSDIESNPNLKKLDNWNKTLVLHDIMKPPENLENWLKDETDKMATLLLKILQEAADGKPKKKQPLGKPKTSEKQTAKGNPYENIRKKQEITPENFLFRVRAVNLSLENDKKAKSGEDIKLTFKPEHLKDIPVQSEKTAKPPKVIDVVKLPAQEKLSFEPEASAGMKSSQLPAHLEDNRSKLSPTALEAVIDPGLISREYSKLPLEITEDIPGPEILKKISNTWKVFPILGSQMTIFTLLRVFQLVNLGNSIFKTQNSDKSRRHAFGKLFKKYGPIVNVQGPLSGNVILIHKPEHLSAVFEQDSALSVRSVFDSLEQIRRDSEEKSFSVGISTDWTKPEWNELKRGTNDSLLKGCEKYFDSAEVAGDSLVSIVRKYKNAQNMVSENFVDEIRRWSLEGLCNVLFEKSFGFLEGRTNSMSWIMEPDKLFMAVDEATKYLNKCERGFQAWRLMVTPSLTGLDQTYRSIASILSKQLYQAEINLKNKSELLKNGSLFSQRDLTFIESMLLSDGMTTEEITCSLIDIILIGTNAMSSSMGFLLYNLAQNVKIQNKLLKELKEVLPHKTSRLDYNKLSSLKYLQACLKENLRLHMPVPIFYRLLQNDILLANYIVPKGTYVVMDYKISCMKEQIFDEPDKFIPERWLNDEKWMQEIHPFVSFPFCHGPRAELSKKVVEMQLLTCAAKIIRSFQVEYHYGEIQGTESIITFPDKPLKLSFIERDS